MTEDGDEGQSLTKIERDLVLQYLVDDNVPLTITLEDKPEKQDVTLVDKKTSAEDKMRLPASAVFPVAIPSEQTDVLKEGIILLKNPARTVLPFLGKKVRVQFYFNRLGLYFITEMKEFSKGLAIVIPSAIKRIKEVKSSSDYSFSAKISYEVTDATVSIDCLPRDGYSLFTTPKWSDIDETRQKEAKDLLEKFVNEIKTSRTAPVGNGIQLIPIVRYLTAPRVPVVESIQGRVKPFGIIFADEKRIVLAQDEGCNNLDASLHYNLSLYFSLPNNKLMKRTVNLECIPENVYEYENSKCVSLKYGELKAEDSRFLYERVTGVKFDLHS